MEMKKVFLIILVLHTLLGCDNNSKPEYSKSSTVEPSYTIPEQENSQSNHASIIEQSFNIPMSAGTGGGNEFVCFLPNGKFVRGMIDYNEGNWIYIQNNEADYKGTYKVLNENLIEVHEKFFGENGGEYTWNFQFKIVDTFMGGQAFELRAINKNGQLTNDKFLWFTSADIGAAKRLNFQ